MKNRVNWGNGFSIGDVDTRKASLKSYISQTNEESVTFDTFKTDVYIKWKLVYSRICLRGEIFLFIKKGHSITNHCARQTFVTSPVLKKPGK